MIKNIVKLSFLAIISICGVISFNYLKKIYLKESIIRRLDSQAGKIFRTSNDIKRFISRRNTNTYIIPYNSNNTHANFKLVYEMNFNCSICIANLIQIYEFYQELSNITQIEFCLTTEEKSDSYIKYWLDQSLRDYDLFVIKQAVSQEGSSLYLLDNSNKIVMAGNIIRYPFLKTTYIKKLRKAIKQGIIQPRGIISMLSSGVKQLSCRRTDHSSG